MAISVPTIDFVAEVDPMFHAGPKRGATGLGHDRPVPNDKQAFQLMGRAKIDEDRRAPSSSSLALPPSRFAIPSSAKVQRPRRRGGPWRKSQEQIDIAKVSIGSSREGLNQHLLVPEEAPAPLSRAADGVGDLVDELAHHRVAETLEIVDRHHESAGPPITFSR